MDDINPEREAHLAKQKVADFFSDLADYTPQNLATHLFSLHPLKTTRGTDFDKLDLGAISKGPTNSLAVVAHSLE